MVTRHARWHTRKTHGGATASAFARGRAAARGGSARVRGGRFVRFLGGVRPATSRVCAHDNIAAAGVPRVREARTSPPTPPSQTLRGVGWAPFVSTVQYRTYSPPPAPWRRPPTPLLAEDTGALTGHPTRAPVSSVRRGGGGTQRSRWAAWRRGRGSTPSVQRPLLPYAW